jgi:hypothetical protein
MYSVTRNRWSAEAEKQANTHKHINTHTDTQEHAVARPSRPKNELTTITGPKTTKLGTATTSLNPRSLWGVQGAGRRAERLVLDYGQPVREYWSGEAGGSSAESPRYSAHARPSRVWVGVRFSGLEPALAVPSACSTVNNCRAREYSRALWVREYCGALWVREYLGRSSRRRSAGSRSGGAAQRAARTRAASREYSRVPLSVLSTLSTLSTPQFPRSALVTASPMQRETRKIRRAECKSMQHYNHATACKNWKQAVKCNIILRRCNEIGQQQCNMMRMRRECKITFSKPKRCNGP